MKFYEQMNPVKREAMILRAAAFNVSLEGMEASKKRLLEEAQQVQSQKVYAILQEASDQTSE